MVCKECKKRHTGCHSDCKDYLAFKVESQRKYKYLKKHNEVYLTAFARRRLNKEELER